MLWESTAALYGCENILPTSWQRGSPDFFFCCCCCWIMAGRNGEVLLSELRCLTLIRRLILLNLRQTSLQQHGDIFVKGGFLGTVQPIWLTWNVKHLSSVHIIFFMLVEYTSHPTSACTPPVSLAFEFHTFACQVQYSTRKGCVFLCSLLCAPCYLRTQTINNKVETHRIVLATDFIERAQTNEVCMYAD